MKSTSGNSAQLFAGNSHGVDFEVDYVRKVPATDPDPAAGVHWISVTTDNWLLMAIKDARQKEKRDAKKGG